MGTVNVDDVICVLKNDKDLISKLEQFLTNMKVKSIGETEKADLKANFEKTRDGAPLLLGIVTQWVLDNGNGANVKSLGVLLKASGHPSLKYKLETTFKPTSVITTKSDAIKKPGCVETLLQIINWASAGRKEECGLYLPELLNLLSNIGSRPVAIISINGTQFASNSILTDGIIKYLKFGRRADKAGFENGFSSNPVDFTAGSRIRIWNEPLYIHNNGKEIGVIVMEQDGTNPITTALSFLLSSVSIFLQSNGDAEQVIQWFCNFLSANEPKIYSKKLYQELIILFNKNEDSSQQRSETEIRQLKTMLLNESSKQQIPAALEKYFDAVNCNIVGIPDGNLPNISSIGHTSLMNFFEKQFSPENLENSVKQVCGKLLTGNSLKDFVCLWAQIVTTSKEKLRPKTILFDTEKLFATNLTSELLAKYRQLMGEIFISSPDLTGEKFEAIHSEKVTELQNEIMKTAVSKSIRDDCGNTFKMDTEALKGNFIEKIYSKPTQQKTDTGIVSSIKYDENQEIGRGSRETIVYKGTFGDRHVAVKRLNRVHFDFKKAKKEVDFLIKCDSHQNVVQLFHGEERRDCYLIALELCNFTLEDWVKKDNLNLPTELDAKIILLQTTEGLAHLHRKRIIHRDIKPQNILLRYDDSTSEVCVKISDFGISKFLAEQRTSATFTSGLGTEGWVAPEILQCEVNASASQTGKLTKKSDIFSLGCVFYYVLTKGEHPFGDTIRRQANILDGKLNVDADLLKRKGAGEAECLLKLMLSSKLEDRPPASPITKHYLLWRPSKISNFLNCTNKCWEAKKIPECTVVKNYLEKWKRLVFNQQDEWGPQLDSSFQQYLEQLTNSKKNVNKHNFSRVDDMIRLIRNIEIHQTEGKLPPDIMILLELPEKYVVEYFMNKFPFLIPVTWLAFQNLKKVSAFKLREYYPDDYKFEVEIGKQLGQPRQSKSHRGQKQT